MARRRSRRWRRRRRWLSLILIAIAVLLYSRFGDRIRPHLGLTGEPVPDKGPGIRVVTWNLRNFEADGAKHDLSRLRGTVKELAPDLLAVQEIKDPKRFEAHVASWGPQWRSELSRAGGKGHQRLGFVYDATRLEIVGTPVEHDAITLGGRVRPALSAYLRTLDGGLDFHILVVHLKARPVGYEQRQSQWQSLETIAAGITPKKDADLILLGDFNTTGPEHGLPSQEFEALDAELASASLRRLQNAADCSAYWDGRRRDAWQEPSLLDLIYVRGFEGIVGPETRVVPGTHCSEHACDVFRSTDAYPVATYERISDHCPVVLDLARSDEPANP